MKYTFLVLVVVGSFVISSASYALAATKNSDSGVSVTIISPKKGDVFSENTDTTIKYKITGLPSGASKDTYRMDVSVRGVDTRKNVPLNWGNTKPFDYINNSSYKWRIPDLINTVRPPTGVPDEYEMQMTITKMIPAIEALTPAQLKQYRSYGVTEEQLKKGMMPKIVASTTSDIFKIYPTDAGMPNRDNEDAEGVVLIGKGSTFRPWDSGWVGNYEIRLESINGKKATFTTTQNTDFNSAKAEKTSGYVFDTKIKGKLIAEQGKKTPFTITDLMKWRSVEGTKTTVRSGTIEFVKAVPAGGIFRISSKEKTTLSSEDALPPPPPEPYRDPKVTTGRASLEVKYVSPFKVRILGSYNDIKSCDKNVKYNLVDGMTQDILAAFVSNSCEKRNFDLTKIYKPGTQAVEIEMRAVYRNDWTHFIQDAILIRVADDGTMEITPNPPSSWQKG